MIICIINVNYIYDIYKIFIIPPKSCANMQRNLRYNDEQNNGCFAKLRAFGARSIGITIPSTMRKTLKLYPGQIVWVTVSVVKVEDDKSKEGQR